jgi:hypothetical protein
VVSTSFLTGCERGHESLPTLESALEALRYGDLDRFVELHVEASEASVYCAEPAMKRLWEKAGTVAESGRCGGLDGVDGESLDETPDELRFLLQVVRFRCENPNGTCAAYGATALRDGASRSPLVTGTISGWEVRKHLGDDAQAVAYVDITVDGDVMHRAVKLRRVGESWRIASGLLEAP